MNKLFIILAAITFTGISCNNKPTSASSTDTTAVSNSQSSANNMLEKNKATALAAEQGFNNHDANAVFKDAAPDFVDYGDGSTPPAKGIDSSKALLQSFITAFPDMKGENLMAIAEGDHVAVFGDWSGTFKGKMMGMKPTNKSFKMKDVDLFTFNDKGQITEHHSVQSMTTIMMQVGAGMKK
ncbi:MAG TPA: ester cyclase [Chitinophagaceae bacterium]|nr:ester cyclase [Chitinophagaceae bacterium]